MAESVIFIILSLIIIVGVLAAFGITWLDPRIIITFIMLAIIPGIYAAFTSGPFVPSSRKRHKIMMDIAELKPDDIVCDLGCGDGRFIFAAAPFVKKAIGYELSIPLYLYGKIKSIFKSKKAEIRFGNIWNQDYSNMDVIFIYLLPGSMKKFYREVWPKLKLGTRVVVNAFQIKDLKPVKTEEKVFLYKKSID